jgi:hypothetical protein
VFGNLPSSSPEQLHITSSLLPSFKVSSIFIYLSTWHPT